jgi:exodeoxyribonuclease-3
MKITTWNVNGYRAVLKKEFKKSIEELSPDILCLQETKARLEQLTEEDYHIPGYHIIWNSAIRPGYSGVALYYRDNMSIDDIFCGLGEEEFDVEGRTIKVNFGNTILFNNYFPNGQRGQDRVDYKLRYYAFLLEKCKILHGNGQNIIITGDFNTAHTEIDLANPKENSKTSGFLPEEREWIDIYLNNGFKDAYREIYPGRIQYTWWTYRFTARVRNIGWRLDYFLVSNGFMDQVEDVIIHDEVLGSDHCPVSIIIK